MSSVEQLHAAVSGVVEHLDDAGRHLAIAERLLAESIAVLSDVSRDHSESLVPPPLRLAGQRLEEVEIRVTSAGAALADFRTRL